MLERLAGETFDVLVVGGGITGAGVALDAATRGLRTALVEADDFASGTSSKSSKLVHGGLRYLQQGDVRLVYEALRERQRLRRNAPHLVKLLPFMIPILTKDGSIPARVARALGSAMWMYDLTGGFRIGKLHKRLKADAAFAHLPTMPRERSAGGYLYYDATADDARLVLDGRPHRGRPRRGRRQPLPGRRPHQGRRRARSTGPRSTPTAGGSTSGARSWSTPPACGPTRSARSRTASTPTRSGRPRASTSPCRGRRCATTSPSVIPVPGDKRSLFVVPWGPRADGTFQPHLRRHDRHRLRRPARRPAVHGRRHRLRPRALNAAVTTGVTRRRRHRRVGRPAAARQVGDQRAHRRPVPPPPGHDRPGRRRSAITGGKLTTYREMAEDTVDAVLERLGRKARVPHQAAAPARRRRLPRARRRARRPPTSPTATASLADRVEALVAADPDARRAARRRAAVPARRGGLRRPPRDGDDARRRADAPRTRAPPVRPRRPRCRGAERSPTCSPPSSAGTTPNAPARSPTYRALVAAEEADAMRHDGRPR